MGKSDFALGEQAGRIQTFQDVLDLIERNKNPRRVGDNQCPYSGENYIGEWLVSKEFRLEIIAKHKATMEGK